MGGEFMKVKVTIHIKTGVDTLHQLPVEEHTIPTTNSGPDPADFIKLVQKLRKQYGTWAQITLVIPPES